jgi:high-affinity iron transporter
MFRLLPLPGQSRYIQSAMLNRSLCALLMGAFFLPSAAARAQENPVRRVANIVSVAVEEYGKGIDASGKLVLAIEYQEAVEFLADAKLQAARLAGERAVTARAILDSLVAAVGARHLPDSVRALEQRFAAALGSEAALELPTKQIDVVEGQQLYARTCAVCHGVAGLGDGPSARGMNPPPPAIGDAVAMRDVTPALMYRIVSVGIAGTPMAGYSTTLTAEQRWNIVAYLLSLRASPARLAEGEGMYVQRCMQCHGALGSGDGAYARALSQAPPEIGSLAFQAARHDDQLAAVIQLGVPGTVMPATPELSAAQLQSVVAYLRTLPNKLPPASVAADASDDPLTVSRRVLALLQESLTAARGGKNSDASDRAFDAYIAFEPMESIARPKSPGLIATMERHFADFRGAVRAGNTRSAERSMDVIQATMPAVIDLTQPTGSGLAAFWQSFLIIFREGLEAILVIGAIVAFLIKTGHRERLRSIWWGVGLALVASAVTAVVLMTVLAAMPATREVIEGVTMLIAVAVLFSVSYWLISKVEAAKWQQFIQEKVTNALAHGGGRALTFVAFLAVYREGAETALFYQALFNEGARVALPISLGILAGGAVLAVVFTGFYRFGIRIPLRRLFGATSVLLYYMAFVFMGKGLRELQEGNALSITVISWAPHVDLIGLYPTVETMAGQLVLLVLFAFALIKTFWPKRSVALPTIPADPTATALVEAQLADIRTALDSMGTRLTAVETAVEQNQR